MLAKVMRWNVTPSLPGTAAETEPAAFNQVTALTRRHRCAHQSAHTPGCLRPARRSQERSQETRTEHVSNTICGYVADKLCDARRDERTTTTWARGPVSRWLASS